MVKTRSREDPWRNSLAGGRVPAHGRRWHWRTFEVPSNPNHPVALMPGPGATEQRGARAAQCFLVQHHVSKSGQQWGGTSLSILVVPKDSPLGCIRAPRSQRSGHRILPIPSQGWPKPLSSTPVLGGEGQSWTWPGGGGDVGTPQAPCWQSVPFCRAAKCPQPHRQRTSSGA